MAFQWAVAITPSGGRPGDFGHPAVVRAAREGEGGRARAAADAGSPAMNRG